MTNKWRLKRERVQTRLWLGHFGQLTAVPTHEEDLRKNTSGVDGNVTHLHMEGERHTASILLFNSSLPCALLHMHTHVQYLGLSVLASTGVSLFHPHCSESVVLYFPLLPDSKQ